MESTLQNNDRLVVWKVPRTLSRITGHAYVPNRGDVIIFNQNNLAEFGQTNVKQLVKRVVGLPGDRVVISDDHITIYNKQHPNGFNPDSALPYGKEHTLPITSGNIDLTLTSNQVFVCGDNRTDSLDSRAFGPVSVNNIVGKLVLRV
jgi:signal peptidase I